MILNPLDLKLWTAAPFTNEASQSLYSLITSSVAEHRLSQASADTCSVSLELLAKAFTIASQESDSGDYVRQILLWMMVVPDEFIALVREHVPEALCIFGFYCVLLERLDGLWFMRGWGRKLLGDIWGLVGERERGVLEWPVREVGGWVVLGLVEN